MKENRTGIYDMIPNDEYRSSEGISKSDLDKIARSIEHWKHVEKRVSKDLIFGSAFHDMILSPEIFNSSYALEEKIYKRTNEGKAKAKEFKEANEGKTILASDEMDKLNAMKDKLMSNSLVQKILNGAKFEQSAWHFDQEFGLLKKCRPDILRDDCILADLKTSQECNANYFKRSIVERNYDKQAAYYLDIISALTGKPYNNFIFIVIEKTPPYSIAVYDLGKESIEVGRQLYKRDLKKYQSYLMKNLINYSEIIQSIELPVYAYNIENR